MVIKFKKLNKKAFTPYHGSEESAGYDFCAVIDNEKGAVKISPGETKMINTGISMQIPNGYFGACYPRSGLASKKGLRLANCVGVIDADYRGEILIPVHNDSNEVQTVAHGDRLMQMIIQKFEKVQWEETDTLDDTDRGNKGFGSTGV